MLNRIRGVACILLLLANLGCASERLYVKVVDNDKVPVSNATVSVDFSTSYVVFGEGTPHHYEARTDTNGNAIVKFNCTTSDFEWHVEADGYYRSDSHSAHFKGEDVIIPPIFGFWKLHEHEKRGEVVLSRFMIGCQKGQGLDSRGHLSSGGGRILTAVGGVLWYNWRR